MAKAGNGIVQNIAAGGGSKLQKYASPGEANAYANKIGVSRRQNNESSALRRDSELKKSAL